MADADFLRKQAPSEIFEPPKTEKSGVPPVFSFSTPYGFGRQTASFLVAQQNPNLPGLSVAHISSHWRSCAAQAFTFSPSRAQHIYNN